MFSNRYIIIYSAIMVLVVAAALTVVAVQLRPAQQYNQRVEKMQSILASAHIESTVKNAEDLYNKYITTAFVINEAGDKEANANAFETDLSKENSKAVAERHLPVFVCINDSGSLYYILPMRGKGLWGPIWGYMAFSSDLKIIVGAMFDHKGETPGLGAEIDTDKFEDQFIGKSIFNEQGEFVSVKVVKGGAPDGDTHAVDAISGGTITSKGLEDMIRDGLSPYQNFFQQIRDSVSSQNTSEE